MTAQTMPMAAYAGFASAIRTSRDIEYDALARCTRGLVGALSPTPDQFARIAEAVHLNRQLWSIFATDVADDANALPQTLRAQIFYLAEFTLAHSRKVLTEGAGLQVLIDINTAVMRGLRGEEAKR